MNENCRVQVIFPFEKKEESLSKWKYYNKVPVSQNCAICK